MLQLACLQQGTQNGQCKKTCLSTSNNRKFLNNCPCADRDKVILCLTWGRVHTLSYGEECQGRLAALQKVCCEGERPSISSPKQQVASCCIISTMRKGESKGNLPLSNWCGNYVSFYPLKVPLDGTIQLASLCHRYNDVTSVLWAVQNFKNHRKTVCLLLY